LPLQTAAELGIVGLALLAAFLAGVGLSARAAVGIDRALAAGPTAAFVTYIAHAPLDWDWQMPAVTIIALVLAGALVAMLPSRTGLRLQSDSAIRGASRLNTHTASTQIAR
jgi:hypothetical protein